MERLTYKSMFGDYGSERTYPDAWDEIEALRNALGKYEDLGYTPEELKVIIMDAQVPPIPTPALTQE